MPISSFPKYSVISGSLSPAQKADWDEEIAEENQYLEEYSTEIQVDATNITFYEYEHITGASIARRMSHYIDSNKYDITIATSGNTVTLTGNKSSEVVTITYDAAAGKSTYTSTNSAHATHVYYDETTSCPNSFMPTWAMEFLLANQKGTPKAAPVLPQAPKPGLKKRLF